MSQIKQDALKKFSSYNAHIAVIGLGYVGLPLSVAFAKAGYEVTGIDVDPTKVDSINEGESYIEDIPNDVLGPLIDRVGPGSLKASTDYSILQECDAVSICVPTPLDKTGEPDISYIVDASEQIARYLHPGMTIVLESTTYPGTTRDAILSRLVQSTAENQLGHNQNNDAVEVDLSPKMVAGQDFFLAFSPERIDPGRTDWTVETMPKVIGGITPDCLEVAQAYYGQAVGTLVPVSSPDAAEMVKLFENTFRSVNIGLANELLLMCDKLGLDAWEVLEAADTKPFGFMKFTPGPGLGGHCIPIDPHYLSWKMRTLEYNARFIELASEINTSMPEYWTHKVQDKLNEQRKPVNGSKILVLGVAYKKNVSDMRESPALDIIHLLKNKGAFVDYHDPHVPSFQYEGLDMTCVPDLDTKLVDADCVVIATDHSAYDWQEVVQKAKLLVDTRHVI
ncbi:MAG: nucleotide sugar dehydrogenase [Chloroflexota bacterium]